MIVNLLNPIITNSSIKSFTDEEAIAEYLVTQNVNYFNLLYDRYSDKVFAKCISMLNSKETAEDTTQEIFVKVLLNLSKFNGKARFSTWLYSVSYNYCIDVIRKNKKVITASNDDYDLADISDDEVSDAEILEVNVNRLENIMEDLNPSDKMILMMKYLDDLSIKEICDMTEKSESAIKMKILRAKERFLKIHHEKFEEVSIY